MVNIYKLKLTQLQQNILKILFAKVGSPINARRISQLLNVSAAAVSKALPDMEKKELIIIKKDKESKQLSIEFNRDEKEMIWLKRADNLKCVYDSGLMQTLYDNLPGATIILFGSYSVGEDTINSDIDLAVMGIKPKQLDLTKFETYLMRKIIINYYPSFQKIDKHLLNNILNGITLKGSIEL